MDLTKISIKRPVAVIMVMLIVLLLGFVSASKMELALMPDVEMPYALIMTQYSNAGPEEVENLVTEPLESAISNVENIKKVMSSSSEGFSAIQIEFRYGTDMNKAVSDLRDRVSMVEDFLPDEAKASTIMKIDMTSMPIAYVVVSAQEMDEYELKSFVENNIENRLERQKGVASVDVSGGVEKEIKVEIKPEQIQGLGIDISSIAQILAMENVNQSGGTVDYGDKTLTISSKLRMKTPEDVKKTPIPLNSGVVLHLEDIAEITESQKKISSISRYNGEACVLLSITKASDGNTVTAVHSIQKEVKKIAEENQNISIQVVNETGSIIEKSIYNVVGNIFIAAFLSILILLVFLKNVGLTGVIAVSMPLSIVGTFVLLYFSGTTLNMVSLGGLSIGVGMLVDNSIVVLENIYRYRTTLGYDKVRGTYLGTKEVLSAIIASTLTTIVVFIPFVFASGLVLQLMRDLALAVVFSLTMSLVVAMTVVPMLAGNYVENVHRNTGGKTFRFVESIMNGFDRVIKKITEEYDKLLAWSVVRKKRVLSLALGISVASCALLPFIGKEFLPGADEGMFTVTIETPKGSKLSAVDELSAEVETHLEQIPELESTNVRMLGSSGGLESLFMGGSEISTIQVKLNDKTKRSKSTKDIMEEFRLATKEIAGAKITVEETSTMQMGGNMNGVEVEVYGDDLEKLSEIGEELVRQIEQIEGTRQVKSSMKDESNQIVLYLDRDKVRQYGLTGTQVAVQVKNAIEGVKATTLKMNGKEMDIRLIYPNKDTATFQNLENITIMTPSGVYLPLSALAKIDLSDVPSAITHSHQTRYITVSCDIYNRDSGSVSSDIQSIISQMKFPDGYSAALGGATEMMNETFSSLLLVILLAVVLVYMVMAGQFESLVNPFIIMFTIPLAFTGAWILLFLFRATMSVMSLIGGLVLVGIVVNNGIVLIEYIDILRNRDGYAAAEAVLKACPTRLRPILMTALTTILGQVPLIFSNGYNSEMLKGMGLVIAGGLATSTFLTLLVIPLLYLVFDKMNEKFREKFKRKLRKNPLEVEAQCVLWQEGDVR